MDISQFIENTEERIGPYIVRQRSILKPVCFGRHSETAKEVVLKEAEPTEIEGDHRSPDLIGRLLMENEYNIQSKLSHPNICPANELKEYDGKLFLVTPRLGPYDFAFGYPLLSTLAKMNVLEDVANALNYMHKKKIVHLDVKGENIVVNENRGTLIDFDAARVIRQKHPVSDRLRICTPGTVAPEYYLKGHYRPQTDVFSLAVVAYEALTDGHQPFERMGKSIDYENPRYSKAKLQEYGPLAALLITSFDLRYKRRPPVKELADAFKEQAAKQDRPPSEDSLELSLVSS